MGKILAICISEKKGGAKDEVPEIELIENFGLKGDGHGGNWHRQVSLLSNEKIEDFKKKGGKVRFGSFGENLVIEGIDLSSLPVGTKLKCNDAVLEVTQIGKECVTRCSIYYAVGDCIMPREGIFARVLTGSKIQKGDEIYVL
ncbi:MAG: MOSC domain-containing protein [Oscillospiraceae bacterium]|nr:MOSC domain-containing protein [Oscillospiraceae bacterium]